MAAARSESPGCGIPTGGIVFCSSTSATRSHSAKFSPVEAVAVSLSRLRPAFGEVTPWQEKQCDSNIARASRIPIRLGSVFPGPFAEPLKNDGPITAPQSSSNNSLSSRPTRPSGYTRPSRHRRFRNRFVIRSSDIGIVPTKDIFCHPRLSKVLHRERTRPIL